MKNKLAITGVILFVLLNSCVWQSRSQELQRVRDGKSIARSYCVRCHSPAGGTKYVSLLELRYNLTRKQLSRKLADEFAAEQDHHGLELTLSREDIKNLLSYVESI